MLRSDAKVGHGPAIVTQDRIARLTDRQRECLRLLYAHYRPGEIATRMRISTDRVNQLLKGARERLGVSRSIDAARILAQHETAPSQDLGDQNIGLSADPVPVDDDVVYNVRVDPEPVPMLRERPATYDLEPGRIGVVLPVPFPNRRRPFNELTWYHRLAWGLAIAVGATVLAGAMVSLQNAVH